MLTVALIGHDAHNDNLGVGALTVSEVHILREIAQRRSIPLRIRVLDGGGRRTPCVSGDNVELRRVRPLRRPLDFYKVLSDSDLIIDISGGDSFTDIYGGRRLFQILLQKYLAHIARRPMVMAPQTVGPFRNRLWRALAARTIARTALVATRDDASRDFVREMGVRRAVVESSDVALRLPFDRPSPRSAGEPVRVGLNVSGLLMQGGYTRDNMFGLKADYPALVRRLVRIFLDHPDGCELHLVGHVIGTVRGEEDDARACEMLAQEFPGAIVSPRFATPSEAKSYIAGLDFFTGARMHACIAAFSAGVPVVPMAYSRKFEGLFGSLGYDRTVDCKTQEESEIAEHVLAAYAARAELAREAAEALTRGLSRLGRYETTLEALLVKLAEK